MLWYFLHRWSECVRSPAARLCAPDNAYFTGAVERARSQSTDVFHSPGEASLRTWSHSRCRFTSPVITLNSLLNWAAVPS